MSNNESDSLGSLLRKAIRLIDLVRRSSQKGDEVAAIPLGTKGISLRIAYIVEAFGNKKGFAENVGISEMQLYRYLNGKNAPSIDVAQKIAHAGNVPPEWLIFGIGTPNKATDSYLDNAGEHIRQLERFDWPIKRLSKATEIPEEALSAFVTNEKKPSIDDLVAISQKTPITLDYLLTGIFPPFKAFSPELRGKSVRDLRLEYESIELYDPQELFDKAGSLNQADGPLAHAVLFHRDWIKHILKCDAKNLMLMHVFDQMMNPTIGVGDAAILDKRYVDLEIAEGIYVLKYKSATVLRRIKHFHDGTSSISGDNSHCENSVIKSENLRKNVKVVGKVVWYGHIS